MYISKEYAWHYNRAPMFFCVFFKLKKKKNIVMLQPGPNTEPSSWQTF